MKNFLGNTCVSGWIYYYLDKGYNSPFIWHLMLDDVGFYKLMMNYQHYINQTPKFIDNDIKFGRYLQHHSIDKNYPIMRLDDVNIHFIHHKDKNKVYDKFMRRLDRSLNSELIITCWDKEIKDQTILTKIKELDNSIVVTANNQEDAAKKIIAEL